MEKKINKDSLIDVIKEAIIIALPMNNHEEEEEYKPSAQEQVDDQEPCYDINIPELHNIIKNILIKEITEHPDTLNPAGFKQDNDENIDPEIITKFNELDLDYNSFSNKNEVIDALRETWKKEKNINPNKAKLAIQLKHLIEVQ